MGKISYDEMIKNRNLLEIIEEEEEKNVKKRTRTSGKS